MLRRLAPSKDDKRSLNESQERGQLARPRSIKLLKGNFYGIVLPASFSNNTRMTFLYFKKSIPTLLGIDITANCIYLVELGYHHDRYILKHFAHQVLLAEHELLTAWENTTILTTLNQLLAETKVNSKQVALAIPQELALIKTVELDTNLTPNEIFQYITHHSERIFNLPASELLIDYEIIGPSLNNAQLQVLRSAATARKAIELRTRALKQLGYELRIVDIDLWALQRVDPALLASLPHLDERFTLSLGLAMRIKS